ncbi:MAG: deoxyribonuclease IV [Thermodesulfobacteriota bacterium]
MPARRRARPSTPKATERRVLLGAHMSISGGVDKSIDRGTELGCTAIQIFTKNATQWKARPLSEEETADFKRKRSRSGMLVVAHDSYLINLGSPDPALWKKSVAAFLHEMERAEALELPYLVMHPGAHKDAGTQTGLRTVIKAFNSLLRSTLGFRVKILLENTAGQGTALGHTFEQLGTIMTGTIDPERFGVCIDTCHAFAAGYDLVSPSEYEVVWGELDRWVGLERVKLLHLNDCKKGLGERVDRHEHIGRGTLGLEPFRKIMNDERFRSVPKIIETPKEADGKDMDPINLGILRSFV